MCQLHHLPLRVEPGPRRRLVLRGGEPVEDRPEVPAVGHGEVRDRAGRLGHRAHVAALVVRRPLVVGAGERVQRPSGEARGGGHHRARVDAAGQAGSHLDVGAQPERDRVGEQLGEAPRPILRPTLGARGRVDAPPALDPQAVLAHGEPVAGGKLPEPVEERVRLVVHPVQGQEVEHRLEARGDRPPLGEHQRLGLGGEREALPVPLVVEGLDPQAIAGAEELAPAAVPDREREHPVEQREALAPVTPVGGEDHLRIARALEALPLALELRAQLDVVVDLAVVGDPALAERVAHRPVPAGAQVDDREAPVDQAHLEARLPRAVRAHRSGAGRDPASRGVTVRALEHRGRRVGSAQGQSPDPRVDQREPLVVGSAMPQQPGHVMQPADVDPVTGLVLAGNAAHDETSSPG